MIAGQDRAEVTALLIPDVEACRRRARRCRHGRARICCSARACGAVLQEGLDRLAQSATGSSNRVARALLLTEPPSIDAHEVTDKGSINQRAVLRHRAHLVAELYTEPYSPRVLVAATRVIAR